MRHISIGLVVHVADDIAADHEALIAHLESHIFDVRALSEKETLLITCRRSKAKIVSDRAVINSNRDTITKICHLPTPPNTSKELWHYQDRQKGQQLGTWRRYRIDKDTVTPMPMLPIPRGKDLEMTEEQIRINRDRMKECETVKINIKKVSGGYKIQF